MNMNDFAVEVAILERGKQEVNIAQIKEILKVTLRLLAQMDDEEIIRLLNRYGRGKR